MPIFAIVALSILAGGTLALLRARKDGNSLPAWVGLGDAVANHRTGGGGGGGGGDSPLPFLDLAKVVHSASGIPANLAISAAGVTHNGSSLINTTAPGVSSSSGSSGPSLGGPDTTIVQGTTTNSPGGGGSFTP